MNAEAADKEGLANPLRVTFIWDLVNITGAQLAEVGMCHASGTFKPKYCGRSCDDIDCTDQSYLVTKNKLATLQSRLNWVKDYIFNTFKVRSVQDDIVIKKTALASYYDKNDNLPPDLKLKYSNTDLVVLMTMVRSDGHRYK